MLPCAEKMFNEVTDDWTFMQDGDPKHTAHATSDWVENNVPNWIPTRLGRGEWPPNSPDLNPIENIWSVIKDALGSFEHRSFEGFKAQIKKVWAELDPEMVQKTVESMDERLKQVIAKRGGNTKY